MNTLNYLGLNESKVANVIGGLNQLLADLQVFYANLHGFHWNVKGKGFFTLHGKYEELYDDVAEKIDEVAERILQLGGTPENRYSEYLKISQVKEDGFTPSGIESVSKILETLSNLIKEERQLVDLANEANDEVTAGLMGDYLQGQEKTVWMLLSFIDKQ